MRKNLKHSVQPVPKLLRDELSFVGSSAFYQDVCKQSRAVREGSGEFEDTERRAGCRRQAEDIRSL